MPTAWPPKKATRSTRPRRAGRSGEHALVAALALAPARRIATAAASGGPARAAVGAGGPGCHGAGGAAGTAQRSRARCRAAQGADNLANGVAAAGRCIRHGASPCGLVPRKQPGRRAPGGQRRPAACTALRGRARAAQRALLPGAGLRPVVLLALAMTAVAMVLARVASGWLLHADVSLTPPTQPGAGGTGQGYEGPSELAPAVQHFGELQQSQSRWIEEQRRFLADATHQLRTPMAVLRTQLQSAIAGDVLVADALQQMLHTVDRASGLANQLLSLSKVEQLQRMGELPSVDLNAMAREAVMELAPLIAAKRLDFALEGPDTLWAPGDAALLGELMRNLLANAIHHTPVHGRLGVLLRNSTGRRELLVWDEGPGIDDAVRQRLFQPFSAGQGGGGLGVW